MQGEGEKGPKDSGLGMWFMAFAGPCAWTLHSLLSVALVPVACGAGGWLLHAVTLLTEALALAGVVVAVRGYSVTRRPGRHFVSGTSIVIDSFFAFVILVEGVPAFVLSPCWS